MQALRTAATGMSAQQLLFDKLDGDLCRSRTLPSTYAKRREMRPLKLPELFRRLRKIIFGIKYPDCDAPFRSPFYVAVMVFPQIIC